MKLKLAIYLAAGLALGFAVISAGLGFMSKGGYDQAVQAHPNAILELYAPADTCQRIGIPLLLVATQLVVIVCARKLSKEKRNVQPA